MAITYSINVDQGIVHSTFSEIVGLSDIYRYFNELRSDTAFQPGYLALCDWRKMKNIEVDYRSMQDIIADSPWGARSFRAVVASSPAMFGMSRMYQSLTDEAHGTVHVFKDIHEAEAWLDSVRLH